mmetsp:Transcript_58441/g.132318  ORF Transcript_58441/g.132318 Transcript_58441/m.132318 type:complete len:210 (-) Transcript_58441:839-1468(-)
MPRRLGLARGCRRRRCRSRRRRRLWHGGDPEDPASALRSSARRLKVSDRGPGRGPRGGLRGMRAGCRGARSYGGCRGRARSRTAFRGSRRGRRTSPAAAAVVFFVVAGWLGKESFEALRVKRRRRLGFLGGPRRRRPTQVHRPRCATRQARAPRRGRRRGPGGRLLVLGVACFGGMRFGLSPARSTLGPPRGGRPLRPAEFSSALAAPS